MGKLANALLILVSTAMLTACGGGGSGGTSSGGGSDATVGTFTGTFSITLRAPSNTVTDTGPITMVVRADGVVIRDPATDGSSATLSGDSFTITNNAANFISDATVSCSGTITQTGTVSPGTVSGTFSASGLVCNGVAFTMSGTFTATFSSSATGASALGGFSGLKSGLSNAVRRAVR
jgi:hypothetical protein